MYGSKKNKGSVAFLSNSALQPNVAALHVQVINRRTVTWFLKC